MPTRLDEKMADRAVNFVSRLKHSKGQWAGKNFEPQPWQIKILRNIFGQINENGMRTIRTVYIEIPRKNGKSTLAAAFGLYLLLADGEPGAEIYSAAADRDQASIVFNEAVAMINQEPELAKRVKIIPSTKRIIFGNSFYRVLSADAFTKHGLNAHGVIFDELHAQPTRELWDVLTTSSGSREQPLVIAITTAGWDRKSICWEQHEYALKVRDGIIKDPTFYPVIFSADEDDDWLDEKVWHKANPGLGINRSIEEMRNFAKKAQYTPALQNTFRRLYLDQWTNQENRWLDVRKWDETAGTVIREDLEGMECWAGLDLASTIDIAAFVLVFRIEELFFVLPFFWVPEESIHQRSIRDRVPYEQWASLGLIKATPGEVIDYNIIQNDIIELGEIFNIREIAFDRWGATQISDNLRGAGFEMCAFGQGFQSMSPPTKELLTITLQKRLIHGGNEVLRWMASNLGVDMDPAGNVKPNKKKSSEKIDGMVALIMGLDRALRSIPESESAPEVFIL